MSVNEYSLGICIFLNLKSVKSKTSFRMNSQEEGQLNRFSSERRSRRDLSPHKPPPVGDVVKGEAPMPEVVPLIEEPHMSSVRQRAAAFDSAGG